MEWSVRPAYGSDVEPLARVHLRSWRWAYRGLLPSAYLKSLRLDELALRWSQRIAVEDSEEAVRVLEVEGRAQGFVTFGPHKDETWLGHAGEVFMLYLEPELVGCGLGRALLQRALEELGRCECYWVVLWVLARNERARRFYERQSLRPDGSYRWDPFGSQAVPVVRYAKALNPVVDFNALRKRTPARRG